MVDLGFAEDIYKLTMLSGRQREDLIDKLHALPGHKSKLIEFFKVLDTVSQSQIYFMLIVVSQANY
jgi:hypothetical protein